MKSIIFSAPSGSGKTTIVQQLLKMPELRLEFSISATTRLPRGVEQQGIDYYFLSPEAFKKHITQNELAEWEEVYAGTYYGTLKSEMQRIWDKGNNVIFDVDVKGGLNLKKVFGNNALAIFIQPPSMIELEKRLRGRGTDAEDKIVQRLAKAEYEMSFASNFDVRVVNDDIQKSVAETCKHIKQFLCM